MEMDFYAALDVEPESTEATESTEGANETGDADPNEAAETTEAEAREDAEASSEADSEAEEAKQTTQSKEDNARFAAARRKAEAERDTAIARAQEEAKQFAEKAVAEVLKTAGLTNPYTGNPIRTRAEFDAYAAQLQKEQQETFVQQSGMTQEQYDAFIQSRPEVQAAKKAKEEADAVIQRARAQEAKAKVDEQVKEISALNPAIQSIADLTKLETYPEIYERVKRGYSIIDAYKLTNLADIEAKAAARAQQQMRNSVQSKAHLEKMQTRGAGGVEVPADVRAEYRALNPGISDEEIRKHYAAYAKR